MVEITASSNAHPRQVLCKACLNFCNEVSRQFQVPNVTSEEVQEIVWPKYTSTLHTSTYTLVEAANSGCLVCKLVRLTIVRAISWGEEVPIPEISQVALTIKSTEGSGDGPGFPGLFVEVQYADQSVASLKRNLAWYAKAPDSKLADTLRDCSLSADDSTSSNAAFTLASYWLETCLQNHSCSRRRESLPSTIRLPTRVIDVGPSDGSEDPRLHSTTVTDDSKYIALSHCWGKEQIITTQKATFDDRCKRIPMSDLSQTFRDAVQVTRRFNIRYLWIDSLCIIQDSAEDWSAESKTMCRIYQDCLFTIAAGHADGGRVGCFVKRDGSLHRATELPIRPHFLKAEKAFEAWFQPVVPTLPANSPNLPLHSRAWVLQEQVLSPRTLLFDTNELHWECLAMHGSERSPKGGIARHSQFMYELRKYIAGIESSSPKEELSNEALWGHTWRQAVHDYSLRGLTKWSDKLIAIYGIADALRSCFGGEYLFGLWRQDLWKGLLWYVPTAPSEFAMMVDKPVYQTYPACRASDHKSPTWSWASVESAVVYYDIPTSHMLSLRCVCRLQDIKEEDETAEIRIEGDARVGYVKCTYSWKDPQPPSQCVAAVYETYNAKRTASPLGNVTWFPEELVDPSTQVIFVAIAEAPGDNGFLDREASTVYALGLVLADKTKSLYRRVGLGAWSRCSWYGYTCPKDEKDSSKLKNLAGAMARGLHISQEKDKHEHPVTVDTFLDVAAYKQGTKVERMTVTIV